MKVVLIYRFNKPTLSIEMLFDSISKNFVKEVQLIKFTLRERKYALSDAIKLRNLNADIYHITGDVHYMSLLLPRKKTILTIHDLNHYFFDLSGWRKLFFRLFWIDLPILYSKYITVISPKIADDINKFTLLKNKTKFVIYNCYSDDLVFTPKIFNFVKPNILQIGTAPHKNLIRVIEAIKNINCKLTIIGSISNDISDLLLKYKIDFESFEQVKYSFIVKKYIESDIVMFVSLREGFGVPIIEAQAVGRVVVTSNLEPMIGVAANGAAIVDPYNIEEIKFSIEKIIMDSTFRASLCESGLTNVIKFSSLNIANEYFNLYLKVCRNDIII